MDSKNTFDKYISGQLSENQEKIFEKQWQENEGMDQELLNHSLMSEIQEHLVEEDVRSELSRLQKNRQTGRIVFMNRRMLAIAAMALVLVAAGLIFWQTSNQLTHSELALKAFEPYPVVGVRGNENVLDKGLSAYSEEDWAKAIALLSRVKPTDGNYMESRFYLGNALLSDERGLEAIPILTEVSQSGDSRFAESADWYLLLAYLIGEDMEGANQVFQRIQNKQPGHAYILEAQTLME